MENPSYDLELSDKSKNWVKPKLLKLNKEIFNDMNLSVSESVQILSPIKNINWYDKWKTGYVAALQVWLKFINKKTQANCSPWALDSILLRWKWQWDTKKWLKNFQIWYNKEYWKNITVDWEPWPESISALLKVVSKLNNDTDNENKVTEESKISEEIEKTTETKFDILKILQTKWFIEVPLNFQDWEVKKLYLNDKELSSGNYYATISNEFESISNNLRLDKDYSDNNIRVISLNAYPVLHSSSVQIWNSNALCSWIIISLFFIIFTISFTSEALKSE